MYYEGKKQKASSVFLIFILMILTFISAILFSIYIKDENKEQIDYEVTKTSTVVEEDIKGNDNKIIEKSIKSVVGISKIENNGVSVFSKEGILKKHRYFDGAYYDRITYALYRDVFYEKMGKLLEHIKRKK